MNISPQSSPEIETLPTQSAIFAGSSHELQHHKLTPVIIFHGNDNALSLARCFGQRSIPVYVLAEANSPVVASRYARAIKLSRDLPFDSAATQFLLGEESDYLTGAVLLAASDNAIEILMHHRPQLSAKFRLDICNVDAQRKMLDKLDTYRIAKQANVPTPAFWEVTDVSKLQDLRDELIYPLLVKPLLSHEFQKVFPSGVKFIVAKNIEDVVKAVERTSELGIPVLLLEMIPGPDSQLCSYYTYLDEEGNALFDFTKRIIRRFPSGMGLATYHITDNVPELKPLALRLFREAGLRGVANAEFKLDKRDNQLKLIECNARFTAANNLVAKAGIDIGSLVYNRLVGLPTPQFSGFSENLTLWDPVRDFRAYREMSKRGELNWFQWLKSIARWQLFPSFTSSDPLPAIIKFRNRLFS